MVGSPVGCRAVSEYHGSRWLPAVWLRSPSSPIPRLSPGRGITALPQWARARAGPCRRSRRPPSASTAGGPRFCRRHARRQFMRWRGPVEAEGMPARAPYGCPELVRGIHCPARGRLARRTRCPPRINCKSHVGVDGRSTRSLELERDTRLAKLSPVLSHRTQPNRKHWQLRNA